MDEMVDALNMQDSDLSCVLVPFNERVRMMVGYVWEEKRVASVKRLIGHAQTTPTYHLRTIFEREPNRQDRCQANRVRCSDQPHP